MSSDGSLLMSSKSSFGFSISLKKSIIILVNTNLELSHCLMQTGPNPFQFNNASVTFGYCLKFDRLPTNHREGKYYDQAKAFCSKCGSANEDEDHVIWCIAAKRVEIWYRCLKEVCTFLSEAYSPPQIRTIILEGLRFAPSSLKDSKLGSPEDLSQKSIF
jgi:hypothetical protein